MTRLLSGAEVLEIIEEVASVQVAVTYATITHDPDTQITTYGNPQTVNVTTSPLSDRIHRFWPDVTATSEMAFLTMPNVSLPFTVPDQVQKIAYDGFEYAILDTQKVSAGESTLGTPETILYRFLLQGVEAPVP